MLQGLRAVQDAGQRVVVGGGDRVELVVVAARAPDCLPQKRAAEGVELLIHHVHLKLFFVLLLEVGVADRQKRRRDDLAAALGGVGGREQIPGDLLLHEPVERAVLVERFDHVIAVSPGVLEDEAAGPRKGQVATVKVARHKIVEAVVQNAEPVEFGQTLFVVEPL